VNEAVQEALKLETALQKLQTEHKIVLMHYAPIRETVEGEPLEIHAFLGSSRLEEPLTRIGATAVFHGHAHHGAPEGKTSTGIPVFNVAHAVLKTSYPDRPPFRLLEIDLGTKEPAAGGPAWSRRATDRKVG
jgi:Icc-related predicted phosphoesterase